MKRTFFVLAMLLFTVSISAALAPDILLYHQDFSSELTCQKESPMEKYLPIEVNSAAFCPVISHCTLEEAALCNCCIRINCVATCLTPCP